MKNKIMILNKRWISLVLLFVMLFSIPGVQVEAKSSQYSTSDIEKIIDGVLKYKQNQAKVTSVQELIDKELAKKAGTNTTEWLVIALNQYKDEYDYNKYLSALDRYVKNPQGANATDLQRIALAYAVTGGNPDFIQKTIKESAGKLGIMSYIYGLILLDSKGYTSKDYTGKSVVNKIIKLRLSDGGWALNGKVSDVDVTAMALQALAPYRSDKTVKVVIDKGLTALSNKQLDTGDYKSWGIRCSESTAQVIAALSSLHIDCQKDKRFIKNNTTLIDALMLYKLKDGSFSHAIKGQSNDTSGVQAMYSLIAYWRFKNDKSSFYQFNSVGTSSTTTGGNQPTGKANKSDITANSQNTFVTAPAITKPHINEGVSMGLRWIITSAILIGALLGMGILFVTRKRNKKNFIAILAVAGIAVIVVWGLRFQSVEDYYQTNSREVKTGEDFVYLSIRCDTVAGKKSKIKIPADGIILDKTEVAIQKGDTVLDVLVRTTKNNKIPLDYEGGSGSSMNSSYIKGIHDLYEGDFGVQSGWLYCVNGKFPGIACGDYKVGDKDEIVWSYTCDLGKDVGRK